MYPRWMGVIHANAWWASREARCSNTPCSPRAPLCEHFERLIRIQRTGGFLQTERNSFLIFSPLSRGRGLGDNCHIFLCFMALARRIIVVTKYYILDRCCQYQDHLRSSCSFLLPIFTHCMYLTYFNFSLLTELKNHNTA